MLTPHLANLMSWFYPVGNTPAVSLTRGLPPAGEGDARILLLGCGDLRNVLFTAHVDGRPMDITCCDLESAVLARNIVLSSLLIDDSEGWPEDLWNMYYHIYIPQQTLSLLQSQAKKLYDLSSSLKAWNQGPYSQTIRFCNGTSRSKIRQVWKLYSTQKSGRELSKFEAACEASLSKSLESRGEKLSGMNLTGVRSLQPGCVTAATGLDRLHEEYWDWKQGASNNYYRAKVDVRFNPMFVSTGPVSKMHYNTDPLFGFHLCLAGIPLSTDLPEGDQSGERKSNVHKIVASARTEFRAWCSSFKKCAKSGIVFRFFLGEGLAFAHTLQHLRQHNHSGRGHRYSNAHSFEPLILDDEDYTSPGGSAPLSFTVIDTSNLIDHLGAVNLLATLSPLLAQDPAACLHTETLVRQQSSRGKFLESLLCGDLTTMSLLIGLVPVDFCMNTSMVSESHGAVFEIFMENKQSDVANKPGGQSHVLITWKRAAGDGSPILQPFHVQEERLAQIFYRVYVDMFKSESLQYMMKGLDLFDLSRMSLPVYHRPAFAVLLNVVKSRVLVDWEEVMMALLNLLEADRLIMMNRNFQQELLIYMHLFGLFTTKMLSKSTQPSPTSMGNNLGRWANVPPVVSVTLLIPRAQTHILRDQSEIGTPPLQCTIQSAVGAWQNVFSAVQVGFGDLTTSGTKWTDSFKVHVTDDHSGWCGTSPMIASFLAPSWSLLLEPERARVLLGVQSTPGTAYRLSGKLGLMMNLYQTSLGDSDHVFISSHLPNQSSNISHCGFIPEDVASPATTLAEEALSVDTAGTASIASIACRLNIANEPLKQQLLEGKQVVTTRISPWSFSIKIGDSGPLTAHFPLPVDATAPKTRIARKSGYVEVCASPAAGHSWMKAETSPYPLLINGGKPTLWNLTSVSLNRLPTVNISSSQSFDWLALHIGTMFSGSERNMVNNVAAQEPSAHLTRALFKECLIGMITTVLKKDSERCMIYALQDKTLWTAGIQLIIFVSKLRLDLSCRSVVLDAAVLPYTSAIFHETREFFESSVDMGSVRIDSSLMKLWKQMLPAWVERCRSWKHKPSCEYLKQGRPPLSTQVHKQVLCSCGSGLDLPDFSSTVPKWDIVAKHCVRAAISPLFYSPLVEEIITEGIPGFTTNGCRTCKRMDRTDGGELRKCTGCQKVKYCSRTCQRQDWRKHKPECSSNGQG